jgi:hypothetical protein
MLAEASVPVLCGMFLEVTSPVLALMMVSVLLHDATALWDVSYAVGRREVSPVEQHVHSFLEMVPAAAVGFISILHWPQVLALFGISERRPDWGLRRKRQPLPLRYTAGMLTVQVLLEWLPAPSPSTMAGARGRRPSTVFWNGSHAKQITIDNPIRARSRNEMPIPRTRQRIFRLVLAGVISVIRCIRRSWWSTMALETP